MALVALRRALRRRRQLGAGGRDDRRCCSPSSCRSRCPRPASSIPDRLAGWGLAVGGVAARDRAAVAGAGARSAARAGDRRLPGARGPPARRGRATRSAASAMRARRARVERRSPGRRGGRARCTRVPRHAVPADRPEHAGAGGGAARRRAELAQRDRRVQAAPGHGRARPRRLRGEGGRRGGARARRRPARDAAAQRPDELRAAVGELRARSTRWSAARPRSCRPRADRRQSAATAATRSSEFLTALDPSFRAQELSFAVSQIAQNIELAAPPSGAAGWSGCSAASPTGSAGALSRRTGARGGARRAALGVAAQQRARRRRRSASPCSSPNLTGVQHSFWVVLGTLSVLRSNALSTGQNIVRGLLGTRRRVRRSARVLAAHRNEHDAAVGAAAGRGPVRRPRPGRDLVRRRPGRVHAHAADPLQHPRARRLADRAGAHRGRRDRLRREPRRRPAVLAARRRRPRCARRWPRRTPTARATWPGASSSAWAAATPAGRPPPAPTDEALRAAAASRRLDDTFRSYLAERGAKPVPLAEVTSLVTGVAGLRLAGDAVLDLWQRDAHQAEGDRGAARAELLPDRASRQRGWYDDLATSLAVPARGARAARPRRRPPTRGLVDAVRHDLRGRDGNATATAVRMIWTGDHLDAARGLQALLREPAHTAAEADALSMFARMRPWRPR